VVGAGLLVSEGAAMLGEADSARLVKYGAFWNNGTSRCSGAGESGSSLTADTWLGGQDDLL